MATYCTDADVSEKLSNVTIPTDMQIESFRTAAYNRINAKLRRLYVVPIATTDVTDLGVLESIEANIAAGRLLMAVATLHEIESVSEYAKTLIAQGNSELNELLDEKVVLSEEAERATTTADDAIDPPRILGGASDDYATFDRPMSGIENDAIEGKVDSEKYNSLEDNLTL